MMKLILLVLLVGGTLAQKEKRTRKDRIRQCSNFQYDTVLMEKIVRLDFTSKANGEKVADLEGTIDELQETLNPDNLNEYISEIVAQTAGECVRSVNLEADGWMLMYRATSGNGKSVKEAWIDGIDVTHVIPNDMKRSNSKHFRRSNMNTSNVTMYRYSLIKNEIEVGYITFRAAAGFNWFSQKNILESTWPAMAKEPTFNFFSIKGDERWTRSGFINTYYQTCETDAGYLAILDVTKNKALRAGCRWDKHYEYPQMLISPYNGPTVWNFGRYEYVDYIAIYAKK